MASSRALAGLVVFSSLVVGCTQPGRAVRPAPIVTPPPVQAAAPPAFELPVARSSLLAPPDAWPVYISTTALFSGSLRHLVATLPPREAQITSGFGREHKRATPNDLYLVSLANALSARRCDANLAVAPRAIVHAHPSTPYRVLLEVLFTLAQTQYSEVYLAVKHVDPQRVHALRVSRQEPTNMTVFIVRDGVSIFGLDRKRVGTGCSGTGFPTIPRIQGAMDFQGLSQCFQKLVGDRARVDVAISANPDTELQTIVSVVDASSAFQSSFNPKVPTSPGAPPSDAPATGTLPTAARTVEGLRDSFRGCYDQMLTRKPDASGGVRLAVRVGEDGAVQAVRATPSGNVDAELVTCVRVIAMNASFDKPTGGAVDIVVPVAFKHVDEAPLKPPCEP